MHSYPHFLIVGMMKCGTTTLYEHLTRHPKIKAAATKELHYFSRDFVQRVPVSTWAFEYHELLNKNPNDPNDMLYGEASPSYIAVPERILEFNPETKIIIILRDPVNRAISQIRQYQNHNFRTKAEGYLAHLRSHRDISQVDVVRDSEYTTRIAKFLEVFRKEKVAVVSFEALVEDPQSVVNSLFEFLKLDPIKIDTEFVGARTSDTKSEDETEIRDLLLQHFATRRGRVVSLLTKNKVQIIPDDPGYFKNY